jgi:hypothetical protein
MQFRNLLFLLWAIAGSVFAQGPSYTEVVVYTDTMTYTSFRVSWILDTASTSSVQYVLYGTDKTSLNFRTPNYGGGVLGGTTREHWVTGLEPSTRYYFRPVSANSAGTSNTTWGCTGVGTVSSGTLTGATCDANGEPPYITTPAKPTDEALLPTQPTTFTPTYPSFGTLTESVNLFTVSSDGSDCQTKITAANVAKASQNVKVIIPVTASCRSIIIPQSTDSNIAVVERPNADTVLPPIDKPIINPSTYAPWPKITTYPGTFAWAVKTFTTCTGSTCNPVPTCGGLQCVKGWYFRGVEITSDDMTATAHPTRVIPTAVVNASTVLRVTLPANHNKNQFDHWVLSGIGGCNVDVNGIRSADNFSADVRLWFVISGLSSCTWDGNGYLLYYGAQQISNITCSGGTDCVVDVGTGNYHGLKTGTYVTPWNVSGCTGLNGGSATSGSYVITKLTEQTFSLDGSSSASCSYVANSGSYAIDTRSVASLVYAASDSSDITLNQVYLHTDFPVRMQYGARMNGDRMAVMNSRLDGDAWYPIGVSTGTSGGTGTLQSINNLTPSVIEFSYGNGHLYQNNYMRCHGVCNFAQNLIESELGTTQSFPSNIIFRRNTFIVPQTWVSNRRGGAGATNPNVSRHHRHIIECKVCDTLLIDGNYMEGNNSGEQTNAAFIGMTPRMADGVTSQNTKLYIRNLTIKNNTFTRGGSVFAVTGHEIDNGNRKAKYNTRNILFENNLIRDMDWNGQQASPYGANAANTGYIYTSSANLGGILFNIWHSVQDVFIRHNTILGINGTGPEFLGVAGNRLSNIVIENNIMPYHRSLGNHPIVVASDGTSIGQLLPAVTLTPTVNVGTFWEGYFKPETFSRWTNNYTIIGTKNSGGTGGVPACNSTTGATCNLTSSDVNTDFGSSARFVPLTFGTASTHDGRVTEAKITTTYRARYNSDFVSGGTKRATDGKDLGADIEALEIAQGKVKGVYLVNGATKILRYTPPDTVACYTKPSNSIITGSWTSDGGDTVRRQRNTTITFGGASTVFLSCGAETYSCSASGGACTLLARE